MSPAPRRRPPTPPPAGRLPGGDRPARVSPVRLIVGGGAMLVAAVVAVAFLTGTAGDLPWGALIGVVLILGAMAVTARRRERRLRETFPDDEE